MEIHDLFVHHTYIYDTMSSGNFNSIHTTYSSSSLQVYIPTPDARCQVLFYVPFIEYRTHILPINIRTYILPGTEYLVSLLLLYSTTVVQPGMYVYQRRYLFVKNSSGYARLAALAGGAGCGLFWCCLL